MEMESRLGDMKAKQDEYTEKVDYVVASHRTQSHLNRSHILSMSSPLIPYPIDPIPVDPSPMNPHAHPLASQLIAYY